METERISPSILAHWWYASLGASIQKKRGRQLAQTQLRPRVFLGSPNLNDQRIRRCTPWQSMMS